MIQVLLRAISSLRNVTSRCRHLAENIFGILGVERQLVDAEVTSSVILVFCACFLETFETTGIYNCLDD